MNLGYDGSGAMAIGVNWPDRVYASEVDSNIIRMSTDGGYNFTIVTSNLPIGIISSIAVNPDNSSEVYVTYKAGSYVVLGLGFHAREDNKFKAILGPCSGTDFLESQDRIIRLTGTYTGKRIE
ncbi:MAG: hypothetical protein K0B08_04680 [Bacteroidales bacterium]|nr:hypothetical protein [Bacteroidales bacterium]